MPIQKLSWLRTPDFHIPKGYQGRSPCLVRGRPVFLRAEVRLFCRPFVAQRKADNRLGEKLSCGPDTAPPDHYLKQLECQQQKSANRFASADLGPMLRSSACLNVGFARMGAPNIGSSGHALREQWLTPTSPCFSLTATSSWDSSLSSGTCSLALHTWSVEAPEISNRSGELPLCRYR